MTKKSALTTAESIGSDLSDMRGRIEELIDEIEEWVSERSDKWQESDAASEWEEFKGKLEEAMDSVDNCSSELYDIEF